MPILVAPVSALRHQMPPSFPWGMPSHFVPEGYPPVFEFLVAQPIIETVGVYERMDEFQDQFQATKKKIQALRGK
ncbi:hypothetical protein KIW84_033998 [Lathyrus oleraceus]|uniref:Uncharacterized protein n=1 Tax=Pisum sativum TaxID=3888 RepID=A0A9D5B3X1_PEA|nr:hypothetical protein KIW84_033998 [Pisum sativum]